MKAILPIFLALCFVAVFPSWAGAAVTTATEYNSSVRMTANGDITCEPQASRTVGTIVVTSVTAGKSYKLVDVTTTTQQGQLFSYTAPTSGATFATSIYDLYVPPRKGLMYETDDTTTGTGHSITIYFRD